MATCFKKATVPDVINQVDQDSAYWYPIMAGVATRAEMDKATVAEIQVLNEVADRKIRLLKGVDEAHGE